MSMLLLVVVDGGRKEEKRDEGEERKAGTPLVMKLPYEGNFSIFLQLILFHILRSVVVLLDQYVQIWQIADCDVIYDCFYGVSPNVQIWRHGDKNYLQVRARNERYDFLQISWFVAIFHHEFYHTGLL